MYLLHNINNKIVNNIDSTIVNTLTRKTQNKLKKSELLLIFFFVKLFAVVREFVFYAGIGFQWKLTDLRGTPKSMVPEKKARPWPGGAVTSKSTLSCKNNCVRFENPGGWGGVAVFLPNFG